MVGRSLPPIVARQPRATPPATGASSGERILEIATIEALTTRATQITFVDPLPFAAGEFYTFEFDIEGTTHKRAYSIAAAEGQPASIVVQSIEGGIVSNHVRDGLEVGTRLRAHGPSGLFRLKADDQELVLIAGGSGITPTISIAETALERGARVRLFYGCRDAHEVIFADRIADLQRRFPALRHQLVLERWPETEDGPTGRLDAARLRTLLDAQDDYDPRSPHFMCGPAPMMDSLRPMLRELGVSDLREERFFSRHDTPNTPGVDVALEFRGARTTRIQGQGTLLDLGLEAGAAMPFSCTLGGCGACRVKLIEGHVEMEEPNCLSDEERASGYVLACCSRPTSDVVVELEQTR